MKPVLADSNGNLKIHDIESHSYKNLHFNNIKGTDSLAM